MARIGCQASVIDSWLNDWVAYLLRQALQTPFPESTNSDWTAMSSRPQNLTCTPSLKGKSRIRIPKLAGVLAAVQPSWNKAVFVWYSPGMLDFEDFSVVAKNRAQPPMPWRWEIYRAGRRSPVSYSAVHFATITEAKLTGTKPLQLFLSEYQVEYPPPAK
jgi:hypothetical protein